MGIAPLPWEHRCQPDGLFLTHQKVVKVPHTSSVMTCYRCQGRGFTRCFNCAGQGMIVCVSCRGYGYTERRHSRAYGNLETCEPCFGEGYQRCIECRGSGCLLCNTCQGHYQLKFFLKLIISYINHKESIVVEKSDLPDELVNDVKGTTIVEHVATSVAPLKISSLSKVDEASSRFIEKHSNAWPSERSLKQRQRVREVAVTKVDYTWHGNVGQFWICGEDRRVYFPGYPKKRCDCACLGLPCSLL
ncbi:protein SSUH2 homolog isoform X1 [Ptychodera flava]|uniref:protein SSUH2 homolog isoform X1 n=1 Tax=Ptychodera flava TaxID=63121 RepID=UPI003969D6C2